MFWLLVLITFLFSGWIIRIKAQQKAQLLYAEKMGAEQSGIGILIHKSMLNKTQARLIIDTVSSVDDLQIQLNIAEKSLEKTGKRAFYVGTLKALSTELNNVLHNENSHEWELIIFRK